MWSLAENLRHDVIYIRDVVMPYDQTRCHHLSETRWIPHPFTTEIAGSTLQIVEDLRQFLTTDEHSQIEEYHADKCHQDTNNNSAYDEGQHGRILRQLVPLLIIARPNMNYQTLDSRPASAVFRSPHGVGDAAFWYEQIIHLVVLGNNHVIVVTDLLHSRASVLESTL